ncbi:class I SAM-dependent methyltransferase [Acinetobacter guillouiae]|uniref:S-adenosyl-L-methionine-dependent methyltransferase n=1 Tax=Acinetobacter guillouiae TaxID=106649 RepID=A0A8X8GQ94_ACIGI|nr:class I SAM-dependent methyltransferase [Acinetobacter guillouiae]MCF0264576.1 class I SAM-dependent methyltransferase [Acinetobacter guillouiae]
MKAGRASKTAEAAAAIRANHHLNANDPVFSDPYAFEMTNSQWRLLLNNALLRKALNSNLMNQTFGKLTGQVVGRSRYTEDLLKQAIEHDHIQQYVLVGAGLDSFVLRLAQQYPQLKIFEIDHPDTQRTKLEKLKKLSNTGELPSNVEFVGIDFEKEKLSDALARSGFQNTQAAFFSWLGTTHYLTPQATLATLNNIASFTGKNSQVVMDYSIDYKALQGIERLGSFVVSQFTRFLKEPLIGAFASQALHHAVEMMGYQVVEDLSGKDITHRYFNHRADHIRHTHATHLIHLKIG